MEDFGTPYDLADYEPFDIVKTECLSDEPSASLAGSEAEYSTEFIGQIINGPTPRRVDLGEKRNM